MGEEQSNKKEIVKERLQATDKAGRRLNQQATEKQIIREALYTFLLSLPAMGLNLYIFQAQGGIGGKASGLEWALDIAFTVLALVLWVRLRIRAEMLPDKAEPETGRAK